MTLSDVSLIGKKILVGVVITLIPFIIIAGGLWATQKLLSDKQVAKAPIVKQLK
ncbi:hypothetical protein [Mucilaginibacter sp.]|uniref:hypothetical protein n=1 Tax=Mucilaginibacter sp. TaxID=1882438 RepID=UPI003D0AA27B